MYILCTRKYRVNELFFFEVETEYKYFGREEYFEISPYGGGSYI